MANIRLATTLKINPPGATPVLTLPQVWKGLVEKTLRPHTGFVKAIVDCDVNEHSKDVIDRTVTFAPGFAMADKGNRVHERVELVEGYSCEFIQDNGSRVLNLISGGSTPDDLNLTFAFNMIQEDMVDGSPEAVAKQKEFEKISVGAIQSTIDTIRKLVQDGKEDEMGK